MSNKNASNDPRRGLPSASALYRLTHCPASFKMGQAAAAAGMVPAPGPEADSGTRIHRYLETLTDEDFNALSHGEQETANICQSWRASVIADWSAGEPYKERREHRLGLTSLGTVREVTPENTDVDFVFTGMADVTCVQNTPHIRRGLIIDYKTGPGEVEHAAANDQLRGLAILAAVRYALDEVTVAIIQPLAGKPTTASFDATTLEAAVLWLDAQLEELERDNEPWAGDWCQYCPARLGCDVFRDSIYSQAAELVNGDEPDKVAPFARAMALPNNELARLLKGRRMIGWYLSAIEGAARLRLEQGETIPGFELKEKNGRRKIADTDAASARLFPLLKAADGGPQAALLRSAQLRPAALTEELQKASGRKNARCYNLTGKDAKALLKQALDGIMVVPTHKVLHETGMLLDDEQEEDAE